MHLTPPTTICCGFRVVNVCRHRPPCKVPNHRGLIPARLADYPSTRRRPSALRLAARTDKPGRPAKSQQILPTGLVRREPLLQLQDRSRVVFHGPAYYMLWSVESTEYPLYGLVRFPPAPGVCHCRSAMVHLKRSRPNKPTSRPGKCCINAVYGSPQTKSTK